MGIFDFIFKNRPKPVGKYEGAFQLLNGYEPVFTSRSGGMYESEMIRSAIHALATHTSKLKFEITGAARPALRAKITKAPNQFQTWSQFEYRLRTIYEINNTAFIVPVYDEYGEPSGIFAPLPERCKLVQFNGVPYLRYEFQNHEHAAIELAYCGIMTKHQYHSDLFGDSNRALLPTMELIHIQDQGIKEGVKSAATYRFMAQLTNFAKEADLKKERKRFTEQNFGSEADGGGMLLFPNTYANIKQVDVKPWIVDADQMKLIRENVLDYFGVSEEVIQNKADGDALDAFFNGAIEPFSIKLSDALTKMVFSQREINGGNRILFTANRLQYMSVSSKISMAQQLGDRGILTIDEIRELFNYDALEDGTGKHIPIRGEYYFADEGKNNKPDNKKDGEDENNDG